MCESANLMHLQQSLAKFCRCCCVPLVLEAVSFRGVFVERTIDWRGSTAIRFLVDLDPSRNEIEQQTIVERRRTREQSAEVSRARPER
jgi:hypothetical protein